MPHRYLLISAAWLVLSCTTFCAGAQSQPPMTEPQPDPSDKLQADLCASKTGDAREECLKEGQDRQITDGVRGDVRAASTNSAYNAARAKCDTLSGDVKDRCIAAAKKKYKQ